MNNINAFTTPFTYRPGQVPPPENWSASSAYHDAESMRATAQRTSDFFATSDNTEADLDPRQGFVRLQQAAGPGVIEERSNQVSGYRTPDGNLQATCVTDDYGTTSMIAISEGGKEVYQDRPVYVNNRYMPTLSTLTQNSDGTCSYSEAYHRWQ